MELIKNQIYQKGQKKFINGMERALKEVDVFIDNVVSEPLDDDSSTIDNIKREIAARTMLSFKGWLLSSINQNIVVMIDNEDAEREEKENEGNKMA